MDHRRGRRSFNFSIGVVTVDCTCGRDGGALQLPGLGPGQSCGSRPVFTCPRRVASTLVGYTTGKPRAGACQARPERSARATYDLGAFDLRGLAAEPDGHFAALLWDATPDAACARPRFDAGGAGLVADLLIDAIWAPTISGSARAGSSSATASTAPTFTCTGSRAYSGTRATSSSGSPPPPARSPTAGRGAARTR